MTQIRNLKLNINKETFPELENKLTQYFQLKKTMETLFSDIKQEFYKTPTGKVFMGMTTDYYKIQVLDNGSSLFASISYDNINKDYITQLPVEPERPLSFQSLHPSTLNALLNSKLLTEEEKRNLLGLKPKDELPY